METKYKIGYVIGNEAGSYIGKITRIYIEITFEGMVISYRVAVGKDYYSINEPQVVRYIKEEPKP